MTTKTPSPHHVVVDGSNIATEGRSMPSLAQLNEAVNSYIADHPGVRVTVVVDATFGHRIPTSEVKEFDAAIANNELVAPPAGAIGRGDAFVLSIAKKAKATILSNDSFQEFHGDHEWLFDDDRLVGGKPVPHVGWVWVSRSPVRGPISRKAVRTSKTASASNGADTRRATGDVDREPARRGAGRRASKEATAPMPVPTSPPPGRAVSAVDATSASPALPVQHPDVVNELMPFLDFVQHHPVGTSVNATVVSYSSHGAYVKIGDVFGYVPLRLMSDPPPRSARDVMKVGDAVTLVVASFAPLRRSIDCAVPNMASVLQPQDGDAVAAEAAAAAPKRPTRKVAAKPAPGTAAAPKAAARKAASPRAAKKVPASKVPAPEVPASKVPVSDVPVSDVPVPDVPVSKVPAKASKTVKAPAGKKNRAPAATTKPAAPRAARRSVAPPDEVVSPAARARRRGPRSAAAQPETAPAPTPPPEATDTPAAPVDGGVASSPSGRPPRRRSRTTARTADT
jgi:Zc3h12a-like ribonuclease protein/S1 RNA binding family protein